MSLQRCPYCRSTDLVINPARGETVCGQCGEILEERSMVAETTFVQTSSGGVAASGARVNFGAGGGGFGGQLQSSSELSLHRGITKLGHIAERLQLSSQIQEAGRRMFQLAVQMGFNAGRPTRFVACACLYIICRRNKSPHLLIDFSDVMQTPVKTLGQTYMRLMRRLVGGDPRRPAALEASAIDVPIIDPSIFIERFARKLDLGNNQRKVQNTAMRLIQFMHRDWICIGRRPNGLCGAALLIAAFYHGLKCTAKDIADVVRLGEDTLRLRLLELRQTPLALMNRAEFEKADPTLPAVEDADRPRALPPCMRNRLRLEERAALMDKERAERAALEDQQRQKALEDAGARFPGARLALPALAPTPSSSSSSARAAGGGGGGSAAASSSSMPPPASRPKKKRRVDDEAEEGSAAAPDDAQQQPLRLADRERAERYTVRDPTTADIEDTARDLAAHLDIEGIMAATQGAAADSSGISPALAAATARIDKMVAGPLAVRGGPVSGAEHAGEGAVAAGTPQSLPDRASSVAAGDSDEEEPLSDVDDEELERDLLDEEERRNKSDIWHEVNKDYLEEWHVRGRETKRRNQKAAGGGGGAAGTSEAGDTASETGSASRSRRWRPRADSCTQAAVMALAKKGKVPSNRINIEALESLFA